MEKEPVKEENVENNLENDVEVSDGEKVNALLWFLDELVNLVKKLLNKIKM